MRTYRFSSVDEQVKTLESRGMVIGDKDRAKSFLLNNSYFNVVTAFEDYVLEGPSEECYRNGVRFSDFVCLYEFDVSLRILLFKYLLEIEGHLKTHLAYEFCKAYGPFDYLNLSTYNANGENDARYASEFVSFLEGLIESYAWRNDMVRHFLADGCGQVPLWALVNVLDFGTLRKFYANVNSNVANSISKKYYSLSSRSLQSMVSSLNVWRNLCAHGNSLIRFRLKDYTKQICDTSLHRLLGIPKAGLYYSCGKRDFFSIVICLKYMLPEEDFLDFLNGLENEIALLKKGLALSPIDLDVVLKGMGLPIFNEGEMEPALKKLRTLSLHDLQSADLR